MYILIVIKSYSVAEVTNAPIMYRTVLDINFAIFNNNSDICLYIIFKIESIH